MSTRAWTYLVGLFLTALAAVSMAAPIDMARMDKAIDLRVSTGQFTGTVLVAQGDKVILNKGYGLADIATKTPNDPGTKFRLGSVTKQFTAASILLLEERGKLKVADPVKKYLPDAPPAWNDITIFHLLTHTSGIPNFTSFPDYPSTESVPTTPEKLVARFRDKPLDFAPGTAWNYSNSGYVLLGYLIEKISGVSYQRFVQDNIFTPLGMKSSGYDSSTVKIAHHATGYAPGPEGPKVAGYIDMSIPFSAGALYSTTGDLLRWQRALFGGRVLKPESLKKMTTPFKNDYAFGLEVRPGPNGGQVISHNGGIEGFNTSVSYVTTDRLSVIVLANLNGPAADQLGVDLEKIAEGEPGILISDRVQKPVPDAQLQHLAGHYFANNTVYTLSVQGDHLISTRPGVTLELYPQNDTEFFARTMDMLVHFTSDAQGQVSAMEVQIAKQPLITAPRISDTEAQQRLDELTKRQQEHRPSPGAAEAVRRSIEDVAAGTPNYDRMSSAFANTTRAQLQTLQPLLHSLGPIKSVDFKEVAPTGYDVFRVSFESGKALEVIISLGPDGKIEAEGLRPASP